MLIAYFTILECLVTWALSGSEASVEFGWFDTNLAVCRITNANVAFFSFSHFLFHARSGFFFSEQPRHKH